MQDYKKEIEMIKNARAYDTAGNIRISKEAEGKILNVVDWLNIEYEEAAELLIELGIRNI